MTDIIGKRVNLCAGSGAGKSRLAAELYGKLIGYNVELVREIIKKWALQNRVPKSFDQLLIFGKQLNAEDFFFQHGIHGIITDSPILMQCYYAKHHNFEGYKHLLELAKLWEQKHPALHIFLDRTGIPFQTIGRYETEEQAKKIDKEMLKFLSQHTEVEVLRTLDFDTILNTVKSYLDN